MHKIHVKLVGQDDEMSNKLDLDNVSCITSEWIATEEVGGSNICRCVVGPNPLYTLLEAIEQALLQQGAGCEYGPRLFEISICSREEYYEFQRVDDDPRIIREFFNPIEIEEIELYDAAVAKIGNSGGTYKPWPHNKTVESDYSLIEEIKKRDEVRKDFEAYNESCSDPEDQIDWQTWVRIGGL